MPLGDIKAHWGAAFISGGCMIIGALIGAVFQGQRADNEQTVLRQDLQEQSRHITDLQQKVEAQQGVIERLRSQPAGSSPPSVPIDDAIERVKPPTPEDDRSRVELATDRAMPRPQVAEPLASKEVEGVLFTLNRCRLTNSALHCDMSVMSRDGDRQVELCVACRGGFTRIIDPAGNQYGAEAAFLGTDYTQGDTALLASGVPMKAGIRFTNLQSTFDSVSLLDLYFRIGWDRPRQVQFRDVPVQ